MKVVDITRKFSYNGIPLPDPNNTLDPNQVREFYSMQYPELATAVVEGPTTKNGVATYTFVRAVGSKGRATPASESQGMREKLLHMIGKGVEKNTLDEPFRQNFASAIVGVLVHGKSGMSQSIPKEAYRING